MMHSPIVREKEPREYILSVAAELFASRGFANVSIRDICEACGVNAPTIYHYFGNKDQLFQAVIQRELRLDEYIDSLTKAVEAQNDPEAKLREFIQHYLAKFPRGFFNPGMYLQSSTQLSGASTERVMAEFQAINILMFKILNQGIERGVFKAINPAEATEYVMNLLMSYVLGEVHYQQTHEPVHTAQFITDLLMHGLCSNQ